jgi:hypothetical protein
MHKESNVIAIKTKINTVIDASFHPESQEEEIIENL